MTAPVLHNIKLKPRKGMGPETRLRTKRAISVLAKLMAETDYKPIPRHLRGYQERAGK